MAFSFGFLKRVKLAVATTFFGCLICNNFVLQEKGASKENQQLLENDYISASDYKPNGTNENKNFNSYFFAHITIVFLAAKKVTN